MVCERGDGVDWVGDFAEGIVEEGNVSAEKGQGFANTPPRWVGPTFALINGTYYTDGGVGSLTYMEAQCDESGASCEYDVSGLLSIFIYVLRNDGEMPGRFAARDLETKLVLSYIHARSYLTRLREWASCGKRPVHGHLTITFVPAPEMAGAPTCLSMSRRMPC